MFATKTNLKELKDKTKMWGKALKTNYDKKKCFNRKCYFFTFSISFLSLLFTYLLLFLSSSAFLKLLF